jgi:iron complex transport system substrate-binding protein
VPAVTEMLFAIGAGPQVVGVSSYDREPREVERLPRVGALLDPDLERILSLQPDLVVIYGSQEDLRTQLARAGTPVFPYRHGGIAGIHETLRRLGERTGHPDEAGAVVRRLSDELAAVRSRVAPLPKPRVLLVIGRDPSALRNMFVSGGIGFLHEVLEIAGGANAFGDIARESVQVSVEQVLARRPEVVIELRAVDDEASDADGVRQWMTLSSVPAVRNGRVHVLHGSDLVVPGPRIARAAERIARVLHPGAAR